MVAYCKKWREVVAGRWRCTEWRRGRREWHRTWSCTKELWLRFVNALNSINATEYEGAASHTLILIGFRGQMGAEIHVVLQERKPHWDLAVADDHKTQIVQVYPADEFASLFRTES